MSLYRDCFQHLAQIERKRIVTPDNVVLRLNRGERPEPLPSQIQYVLKAKLKEAVETTQQYPSYQQFYARLSKYTGFPKEQTVVGAGIEEFIRTLMFLCCDPGQKAVVLWPTCAMYDIYANAFGAWLYCVKTAPGQSFTVVDFIKQIPIDARVVFVPNPGQPVETCFSAEELGRLAYYCHANDIVLVIDEAHFGFGAPTAFSLVNQFDNLLVMRTFSKFFGAASIRVGYVVGQERVIKPLDAVRPSGEISGPSMLIATVLMDNASIMIEEARGIARARDWLRCELKNRGFQAWGKKGFSVLIDMCEPQLAQQMAAHLADVGVYVKSGFPDPAAACLLVACGSLELMKAFYAEFEKACEKIWDSRRAK